MNVTLYAARCRGNECAIDFPDPHRFDLDEENEEILIDQIIPAVSFDHDPANFGGKTRSGNNFICCDVCTLDIDNADPDESTWKTLEDVRNAFPDVAGFAVRSRSYMKESHGNTAPRWHIYFAMDFTIDGEHLRNLRKTCNDYFPGFSFDKMSMDPSHFYFGVINPHVDIFHGSKTLDEFFKEKGIPVDPETVSENGSDESQGRTPLNRSGSAGSGNIVYYEGTRNSSTFKAAVQMLTLQGDRGDEKNREEFSKIAARCSPPLPEKELETIYQSALKRFHEVIEKLPEYKSPEEYAAMKAAEEMKEADQVAPVEVSENDVKATDEIISKIGELLAPDPSDVGQGIGFRELYGNWFRVFEGSWLHDTGQVWEENKPAAVAAEEKHTQMQIDICRKKIFEATEKLTEAKQAEDKEGTEAATAELKKANSNYGWAIGRRRYGNIDAALKAAAPFIQVKADDLDRNPELLNTPAGIVDLTTGTIVPYSPDYLMTKITAVAPGDQGADIWSDFLTLFTDGDKEMQVYLQRISGSFLYGDVLQQRGILAYSPEGGTGKSTYFDSIQAVMGDYASGLAPDILTMNNRLNKRAELATLRGLRLAICAELSEGTRLDSSMLKQLCSIDLIRAERKYCDPFSFKPSHSLVLYSNYLPRVTAQDSGTWDRILVLPFNHKFRGMPGEKNNYSKFLVENAGPAILKWMISGAVDFLSQGGLIQIPEAVKKATNIYREENDIIAQFLDDCCILKADYTEPASKVYGCFKAYCERAGVRPKSIQDFRHELEAKGFEYHKSPQHNEIFGIQLKVSDFNEN